MANLTKDEWGTSVIPVNLGAIHHTNGNYDLARGYFEQSTKEAERLKDYKLLGWGFRKLAETYLDENNFSEANLYFDKALELAELTKQDRLIAYSQFKLAEIY